MGSVKEQFIVDEEGERVAIILPPKEHEKLKEDLHDLAFAAECRDDPVIPFKDLKARFMK